MVSTSAVKSGEAGRGWLGWSREPCPAPQQAPIPISAPTPSLP